MAVAVATMDSTEGIRPCRFAMLIGSRVPPIWSSCA